MQHIWVPKPPSRFKIFPHTSPKLAYNGETRDYLLGARRTERDAWVTGRPISWPKLGRSKTGGERPRHPSPLFLASFIRTGEFITII